MRLLEQPYPRMGGSASPCCLALLPAGAVEAHGPHLPLGTDVVIAEAMAEEGAKRLAAQGWEPVILPPITYTAAPFAAEFPGTISVSPETVTALVVDIARALTRQQVRALLIANAHFDPAHIGALYAALEKAQAEELIPIVFPDVTRKPWALRLSEEFKSGACHAGQYEGSIVLAARPELVDEAARATLAPNMRSLAVAIREGKGTFHEAGGPLAYFGDPRAASAEEGRRTIETLGEILAEAVTLALE